MHEGKFRQSKRCQICYLKQTLSGVFFDHEFKILTTDQIDRVMLQIYFSTGTFGGNYSSSDISIAEKQVIIRLLF